MNRVFKVVFNRERGKSMVVNEVTRSHQVGKKAAITVAVAGALMAGSAFAIEPVNFNNPSEDFISDGGEYLTANITANNITFKENKGKNGLSLYENGTLTASQNITLNAGEGSNGLILQPGSAQLTTIKAGGDVTINAGGWGIHVEKSGSLDLQAKNLSIKSESGITNNSDGTLNIKAENINVTATGGRLGIASHVHANSVIEATNKLVINHSAATAGNDKRIAVLGRGNLTLKADAIEINSSPKDDAAIFGLLSKDKGNIVLDAREISVTSTGNKIARPVRAEENSKITLGSTKTETVKIVAKGGPVDGDLTIGIQAHKPGASVSVNSQNLVIESMASGIGSAMGLIAQGVTTENSPESNYPAVNLNSKNIYITAKSDTAGNSSGISAMSQGVVNVNGNLNVNADASILTRGHSVININQSGEHKVVLNGDILFDYAENSKTTIDSKVNINLSQPGSVLNGNILRDSEAPKTDGKDRVKGMKLKLSNGGTWNSTEDSFVNELTLDKGGVVNVNLNEKGEAHDVTVNTLKGENGTVNVEVSKSLDHGAIVLDKSYARPDGDLGADSTTKQLAVNLTGVTADNVSEAQFKKIASEVVEKAEGTAADVSHKTTLAEGDYNGAMSVVTSKDGKVGAVQSTEASSLMQDSLTLASAGTLSLNRILMNDVRKRLGDIRVAGDMDGAWARYDGGKLSGDDGLENKFHTIQLGYDMALSNGPRVGMAASYTKGDTEYKRGDADMNAYSLAAYSVWMADNGMFADVIARVAKAENDMKVDGSRKGSLDSMAYSVSGEFGWRFDLTDMVYVEPQVEATYTYIDSDSMKLGSSRFDFDNVDSLMGRAGFAAGFKCPADKGDVYVRVSAVHEFLGDAAITGGNGKVFEVDGKDTWVEYGIGANFNVNKNMYVYADLERTSGATLDEDWRANVGVRYNF